MLLMYLWRKLFFSLMYLRTPPWDTNITPPEVEEFVQTHPPGRALDLGCGTGTNVIYLAQHGWQAMGVDFVSRTIHFAEEKARQAGVEAKFYTGNVTNLSEIEGNFDLILDIGCFHSLSTDAKTVYATNFSRLLAPQGTFLLYGFIKENGSNPGITPKDIDLFLEHLYLVNKQTGKDGRHTSVWLTYSRP
jgi:cyclopropane fatty-acyl-phospholipid synthase-like methyltransferase